jgi:hypothetical protein
MGVDDIKDWKGDSGERQKGIKYGKWKERRNRVMKDKKGGREKSDE